MEATKTIENFEETHENFTWIMRTGGFVLSGNIRVLPGPGKVENSQTTANVVERVNTIIRETIQRSEFTTADGVRTMTRMPPSSEAVEEIKSYGDQAVPALQDHFYSGNAFEYEIAMRLMGELGGKRIIEPLKQV